MRISPRRSEAELEAPFRTPEQLALALPLIAMIGLMVVVSAVATGGSGRIVALVALGGFGLCALAPMALIEFYVTRPLRGALAQMRAARDGRAPEGGAFPSGVLADLVALARDLQAAQTSLGAYGAVHAQCEKLIGAGEEAVRALRLQSEELAETAAIGEGGFDRAARAQLAALGEALKDLRAAPGQDGANERLEAMLVYIAESLERIETRDRQIESGVGQVEQGVTELSRQMAREAEAVQGALSSGGRMGRVDVAAVVVDEKVGRDRLIERIDAMETRLAAKLAEAPSPDAREIAQAIHAESEANRRALQEDAASGRLETVAAQLSRAASQITQTLNQTPPTLLPDMKAFVETLAGLAETMAPGPIVEALRAEFDQIKLAAAPSADPAPVVEALRAELSRLAEAFARLDAGRARAGDAADFAPLRADLQTLMERVAQLTEDRAAAPLRASLQAAVAAGLGVDAEPTAGAIAQTLAAQIQAQGEGHARRLDEIETRVVERFLALERDDQTTALTALMRATQQIGEAVNRLETLGPAPEGAERLGADIREIARAVAALATSAAPRIDPAPAPSRAQIDETEARLTRALELATARVEAATGAQAEILADRLDAATLAPAREALAAAAVRFEVAQTQLADFLARNDAGALLATQQDLQGQFADTLRGHADAFATRLDAAALDPAREALSQAVERFETAQARLAEVGADILASAPALIAAPHEIQSLLRLHAHDLAAIAPARVTLAEAAARFDAAQAQVKQAAAQIEAGAPLLAAAPAEIEARLAGFAATLQAHADALAALAPMREAMTTAANRFEAAQTRIADAAVQIETGATAPQAMQAQLAAFAQTLGQHADDLAALAPARAALADAAQQFETAQARLAQAAAQVEAGDPRLDAAAEAVVALEARFAALNVEALPEVVRELGQTQTRWRELVGQFQSGADKLAERAEADGRDIEALRADFAAAGDNVCAAVAAFATRFDAEALSQVERLAGAVEVDTRLHVAALAQTMRDLAEAQTARLAEAVEAQNQRDVGAPLAEIAQAMQGLKQAQARIEATFREDPRAAQAQATLDALREDFAATAEAAAAKFDDAAQTLTRNVEDRVETLRRGELWPAIAAAQSTAQDLHKAQANLFSHVEALKAAVVTDRSGFAALRLDVVDAFARVAAVSERADTSMREAAQQAEALAASVAGLGGAERADLGRVSQALVETGAKLETAARLFEDKRGDLDLPALAADLKADLDARGRATAARAQALESGVASLAHNAGEALTALRATAQALDVSHIAAKLDGFASTHESGLRGLEQRLTAPAESALDEVRALAGRLQQTMAQRGGDVVEAISENTARLDALARLQDERLDAMAAKLAGAPDGLALAQTLDKAAADLGGLRTDFAAFAPDASALEALRGEIAAIGESVRAGLAARELRPASEAREPKLRAPEPKTSGAVAKLVVSMADALDFRFSHIETAIAELAERLSGPHPAREDEAFNLSISSLAQELHSASETLKSGLSDFVGVSAALAEEVARSGAADAPARTIVAAYKH